MIYNSSMLGDLKPLTRDPYPKGKGAKMLNDPWGYAMQCYDAMRDLRDKIGVLQVSNWVDSSPIYIWFDSKPPSMLELYIIAFLILFTNQKHKNMSLTLFVL